MIFSQYRETCQVILDDPKIGGDDVIEYYAKKAIRNLLHANIDVHSRRLIAEFPKYGPEKGSDQTMPKFNGKVSDDSV